MGDNRNSRPCCLIDNATQQKRKGRNKNTAILTKSIRSGTERNWSLNLRSTPKRVALWALQGFRGSRETSDIFHGEVGKS
jgi:hypothetical protein